jgi:glycerol-3-phosphate O-acyltransferase 3/4
MSCLRFTHYTHTAQGTCVNNNYCVQFKKGVFELGAEVCPIAIRYNPIFVNAFWNSRRVSFQVNYAQ